MREHIAAIIRRIPAFYIGLILFVILYLPILCLNSSMVAVIHDEFDGEILSYILQAKHLGDASLPELFNGTGRISMTPPAPTMVLAYMLFRPAVAFFLCYLFVAFTAYAGMYLCVNRLLGQPWIAMITGLLFAILPFYSVYGLSVMGQPLVVYAFYSLWKDSKKRPIIPCLLIALFTLFSSLVLAGYADLILLLTIGCAGLLRRHPVKHYFLGWLEMLCLYLLTNYSLILSTLGLSGGFVSHKEEFVASPLPFLSTSKDMFLHGMYHAASHQEKIVVFSLLVLVAALIMLRRLSPKDRRHVFMMAALYLLTILIALFYGFWHSTPMTSLKNTHGGVLASFQVDRFYWLYPCLWFLILAYTLHFLQVFLRLLCRRNILKYAVIGTFVLYNAAYLWLGSSLRINVSSLRHHTSTLSGYSSVDAFFQEDMFADIRDTIGRPQEDYRVISVGLYPSIALYNGFYCLDGYSNNYDIRYKHAFRQVISGELDRSESLRLYYDNWGNRCYAFSSELDGNTFVPKDSGEHIHELDLDYEALRQMGGEYILSAVEIDPVNPVTLIRKFSSETSCYDVYLYRVQ